MALNSSDSAVLTSAPEPTVRKARNPPKEPLLPCPIRVGQPERYKNVRKHCTEGQMFKGNARVKYV